MTTAEQIISKLIKDTDIVVVDEYVEKSKTKESFMEEFMMNNFNTKFQEKYGQELKCGHLQELNISEDCTNCQEKSYNIHLLNLNEQEKKYGFDHHYTLSSAFNLFYSCLIVQYKLTEGEILLTSIKDACLKRKSSRIFYQRYLQACAFNTFKQGKFNESINAFLEQITETGPNKGIYENIALAYSRIQDFTKATEYYVRAILITKKMDPKDYQLHTLYMGLSSTIAKSSTDDAIVLLEESMVLLKKQYGNDHSLMAKSLGALSDLYLSKKDYKTACTHVTDACRIYKVTCGVSPLTAQSYFKLGMCLLQCKAENPTNTAFIESLLLYSQVDTHSIDLSSVNVILTLLKIGELYNVNKELFMLYSKIPKNSQNGSVLISNIANIYVRLALEKYDEKLSNTEKNTFLITAFEMYTTFLKNFKANCAVSKKFKDESFYIYKYIKNLVETLKY